MLPGGNITDLIVSMIHISIIFNTLIFKEIPLRKITVLSQMSLMLLFVLDVTNWIWNKYWLLIRTVLRQWHSYWRFSREMLVFIGVTNFFPRSSHPVDYSHNMLYQFCITRQWRDTMSLKVNKYRIYRMFIDRNQTF